MLKKKKSPKAASSIALIFVLALIIIEAAGVGLIVFNAYNNQKLARLTVVNFGCDLVTVISNESSQVYTVYDLEAKTINLPVNSNVTIYATISPADYLAGWDAQGGAVGGRTFGNNIWFILSSDGKIGVAASFNQSLGR